MKAQKFFGGTQPKKTGVPTRQVGNFSAGGDNRGMADTKAYKPKSSPATHRPSLRGKVDNRKVGQ